MLSSSPVSVVTGGSRGIGLAIVRALDAQGHRVVSLSRSVSSELRMTNAVYLKADVRSAVQLESAFKSISSRFGKVDVLVNNAGVSGLGRLAGITDAQFRTVVDTNVLGCILSSQIAEPLLRKSPSPVIVNLASQAALRPEPNNSLYSATKAAVVALTQAWAIELAPIRVVAVCPGQIETNMWLEAKRTRATEGGTPPDVPLG